MAVRDKSQRVAFVYSNIYEIYRKAKSAEPVAPQPPTDAELKAALAAAAAQAPKSSNVIRADELTQVNVSRFQPKVLAENAKGERVNPFDDLKSNIAHLQDLHSKLRFMLKELEELVGKK